MGAVDFGKKYEPEQPKCLLTHHTLIRFHLHFPASMFLILLNSVFVDQTRITLPEPLELS